MERKKLYKAKKNWVIGLATGLAIMALGTNIAYADNNTSNEPVVTTQQANASTQQTTDQQGQVNVQPENTIGMSSNVASNPVGSYNKDNVGYANPNSEEQYYDALQENAHHLSHQRSYNYPEKLLDKFARKDDMLKKYGVPNVYEYSNGSENPYKNVKIKQITTIPSVDADKIHYYNNGVSNAIHFYDTQGEPNYKQINKLSQALSYADYELLTDYYSQHKNTDLYGRFYDGDKVIVTPKDVLSTQDLNALYKAAYKNRPIITFDGPVNGHHITSFLQSSISSFNDGWNLTFDNGWRGYTFMDGKQIAFTKILRKNGKDFSWKNVVLKYFAQSLAYKKNVAKDSGQKTPYMLVGRNHLPITDILTSRKLNRLENPFNVSPTEFIFANDGVYVIINGAMAGYDPILVRVPKEFLKTEYSAFYDNNMLPDLGPTNPAYTPTEDIDKLAEKDLLQTAFDALMDHFVFNDKLSENIAKQTARNIVIALQKTGKLTLKSIESFLKDGHIVVSTNGAFKLLYSYISPITSALTNSMPENLLATFSKEEIKDAIDISKVGEWWSTYGPANILQTTRDRFYYHNNMTHDNASERMANFENIRSQQIKEKEDFGNGSVAAAKTYMMKDAKPYQLAAITIGTTMLCALLAIGFWSKYQSGKLANIYGIKIKSKFFRKK